MNIPRLKTSVYWRRKGDALSNNNDTRLICIPGIKPVTIPAHTPKTKKIINSVNINC